VQTSPIVVGQPLLKLMSCNSPTLSALNLLSTATKPMVGFDLMLDRNIIEWFKDHSLKKNSEYPIFSGLTAFQPPLSRQECPFRRTWSLKIYIFFDSSRLVGQQICPDSCTQLPLFQLFVPTVGSSFSSYLSRETFAVYCASCVPPGELESHSPGRMKGLTLRSLPSTRGLCSRRLLMKRNRISN
jgi:hypothetical protein